MKTTIRNRTAALAITTVAGLAGIGLVGGPAMAADASSANSSSETSDSGVGTQSVYYPTVPVTYADELVRAWGQGATDRVEAFGSAKVAEALAEHGNVNGTHWDRVGAEGAAGTVYVDYENTATGETMTLGVANEAVSNPDNEWGTPHGVHSVKFGG
jgi:hypothetical protein